MGNFVLHELILCVSEGFPLLLLCMHNVGMETEDLHELILCVSDDPLSERILIHIVCMGTFALHGLILCVSGEPLSQLRKLYSLMYLFILM